MSGDGLEGRAFLNERCIGEIGFGAKFREMCERGAVETLSLTRHPYHAKAGIEGRVCVMRVA